jgi:NADP-dependent 3-hydroxy acid dehydrogenase YdfG
MINHIDGRVVVVTGAGSGFGRLTACGVGALGGRVVAVDIDSAAAEATAAMVNDGSGASNGDGSGHAIAVAADVTRRADMETVAARAVERFGAIDVLVNNAGVMPLAFFADHARAMDAWDRAIDVNLKGVLNGIAAVYDQMMSQRRGHVVNIASIYANRGVAGSAVYSATKAAVVVLSDSLRVETQGTIKVTVVRPTGVTGTNLGASVVNGEAMVGIAGENGARYGEHIQQWLTGTLAPEATDVDAAGYWAITPEDLASQIVAIINTPWGLTISDITIRATGEDFVL